MAFFIGGSASGKTSVAQRIIKNLNVPWVVLLSMDSFYKDLTPEEVEIAHRKYVSFDLLYSRFHSSTPDIIY